MKVTKVGPGYKEYEFELFGTYSDATPKQLNDQPRRVRLRLPKTIHANELLEIRSNLEKIMGILERETGAKNGYDR